MYASLVVLIACIAGAVVLAGVVLLLVMLGRQDTKRQPPDPWRQDGSGQPPHSGGAMPSDQPGGAMPSDPPGDTPPYGQQPPPGR